MKRQPLRVGFDLDGVLLYNPIKIARFPIEIAKRLFFKKRLGVFYVPTSPWQKAILDLLHKTSLYVDPGYEDIKKLVKSGKIKAFIITARYSFLNYDIKRWFNKMKAHQYFSGSLTNKNDEQPHLFKENAIKKFKLDIFVEDNWDIVKHLKSKNSKLKVFWLSNILDRGIKYPHKFKNLKAAVKYLKSL